MSLAPNLDRDLRLASENLTTIFSSKFMKNLHYTVLIVFALSISLYGQRRVSHRPTTKRPIIIQTLKDSRNVPKPATLGVTFERYATTTEVNGDGTSAQTWEITERFNTETAAKSFSTFRRTFNGDLNSVEVLDAQTLKADGTKVPVPAASIQIKPTAQAEAAPNFSHLKMIEIKFDDLKVGDAAFIKFRILTTKSYFADNFDQIEVFPPIYEWKSIEINLTAPKDFPLYTQAFDLEGGKLADENGRSRWHWKKENKPAVEIETAMLDMFESSPKLAVTSYKDYEALGAAYWTEASKKSVVTPEIQTLADEITRDIKEPQAQAYAIYEWTNKNIRYLSIVLERDGWIPHDASQILANRFGDCKDYTTLLHTLLKAKNIESYPTIIRADNTVWFPDVAVPSFFNHAILYIPSIDLFADATAPNTRLGLIPQQIVGKKAFLAGTKNGVIKVPDGKPEDNQLLSDVDITFASDGSLKAVSKNRYQGRSEIIFRPMFSNSNLQKGSETFIKLLLGYYGVNGTGKILRIANPFKVGEPFEVEMEVEQNNFTTFGASGSVRVPTAVNIINMLELEAFVKDEKRYTNLTMGATLVRENFKMRMPDGFTVATLPEPAKFSNAVGSFRSEFKLNGASVEVLRELIISKDVISAAEYPQFQELIGKMVAGFNSDIKYHGTNDSVRAKRIPAKKTTLVAPKTYNDYLSARSEKVLTVRQVAALENKLVQSPDDYEARLQLVRYYSDSRVKSSPAKEAGRLKNRLWFIRNRPEMGEYAVLSAYDWIDADEPEYKFLKAEWLKQIAANPQNSQIRLNAAEFLRRSDSETAEKILSEARKINPEDYELPLALNEIYQTNADKQNNADNPSLINENRQKAFETGEAALTLLKKERSSERDDKRRELLTTLSKTAYRLDKFDRAKQLATELILDFGKSVYESSYEKATHTGNIVLGLVALRQGDPAKAKEYLLIAIHAPLRDERAYLNKIDTELAKELYAKGEKNAVAEYLKLCENLGNLKNYPNTFESEIKALKLWQEQIKEGKMPSFDFEKP